MDFRFLVFIFLFTVQLSAQKVSLDKVNIEELKEKFYKEDTSAVAAILFKKAKTIFKYSEKDGFISTTEFEVKLKIYKKEGFNWANFEIPYYVGYENLNDELVDVISAYTYNIENDQIIKEKVVNQRKLKKAINEYWAKKTIIFPNVKEGSIIEIKYRLKSENLSLLPEFQFQYNIPVSYATYQTLIPEFYIYKGIRLGFAEINVDQKIENVSQSFDNKYGQTNYMDYKQINTTYTAKKIKSIKKESFINNIDNYYGKISHELQTVRMPEQDPNQISTTWEDVAKSIYEDNRFGKEIKEFNYLIYDLKLLIKDGFTIDDKINVIFNNVKNRMNWNGYYGYYTKQGVVNSFKESSGNVAEINFILLSMLKLAGVEAYPVLVSTRENGVAHFPNKSIFNYVIVAAINGNETLLLDATDKNSGINMLPIRDLNWLGRIIKEDGSSIEIDLMPKSNSKEVVNIIAEIKSDGEVTGKMRDQYFDYNGYIYRDNNNGITKESIVERIEKKHQGLEISDYDVQNNSDLTKPIVESFSFLTTNAVEIIGDKMYFSPLLFLALTENPFKQEIRQYPIDFVFPHQDKYTISIKIPEGYTFETVPQSIALALPENLASFKYNISNTDNQIQLTFVTDINQAIIGSEYYEAVKEFFKEMVNKNTEKVVLKKT
ncbi:MAG TPA: DUF3857 domain-containing protein [Flavobacterium sp.]|nr:DUF3857 domain-containing protein [Flavobacterium sp.]